MAAASDILSFVLPASEGVVFLKYRNTSAPSQLAVLFDEPLARFQFWHCCGGQMQLIELSGLQEHPAKTVLYCQNCGSRTLLLLPSKPRFRRLLAWIIQGAWSLAPEVSFGTADIWRLSSESS